MNEYMTEPRERQYQNALVKRFQEELDYTYLGNWEYPKGSDTRADGQKNSSILTERLTAFLQKRGCTDYQIASVIDTLKNTARLGNKNFQTLTKCSHEVYELLSMGVKAKPSPDEFEQDVMLFDFNNIENNDFAIAEEVSYTDPLTGLNKRPDIVVYVNGIAIAIIELKRSLVSYQEGIRQHLSNETDFIPSFFTTTQFTIASNDGVEFRYGTIGTPLDFWCKWKADSTETGKTLTEKESYSMFFNHENLLFFLRYGVLNDGGKKKVLRPHQLYAIKAAGKRMPTKASGVIWHSQGSGKSLTMVALANYIRKNFPNPRIIVITDRTELDIQLHATFAKGGNNIHQAKSGADLLNTLNSGSEWLISTLIHKFGANGSEDESYNKSGMKVRLDKYLEDLRNEIHLRYPNGFNVKGENIFVFIDECHRTQSGLLHKAMKEIMGKEVMLIGFTGTPLLKRDKDKQYKDFVRISEVTFGPFIHQYLHKQAVEDGVILDLQYEYRNVEQQIDNQDKLQDKFDKLISKRQLTEDQQKKLQDRWTTLERVYSTSDRIERIGYSILDDYQDGMLKHDWANGMLVAGSIYQAYRYYQFFQEKTPLKDHVAVITSYDPQPSDIANDVSDIAIGETETKFKYSQAKKSFADTGDAGVQDATSYEAWAKKRFINEPANMKLLIVVNKLLTGFDAPCATVLYLDNALTDHTLFQAICRVNRLGEDIRDKDGNISIKTHKEFGLIVDFKNLFDSIENVVTTFNSGEGFQNMDEDDIKDLLDNAVCKNLERLQTAHDAYLALKSMWEAKSLRDMESIAEYYVQEYDDESPAEDRRLVLYQITGGLVSAFNNMTDYFALTDLTEAQIEHYEKLTKEAGTINRKVKQKSGDDFDPQVLDPDMRRMLDQYVRASDAETIIKQSDFSFLDLITDDTDADSKADETIKAAGGNANGAAEVIEGKARRVNTDWNGGDAEEFARFAEKLKAMLEELKTKQANARDRIIAIINLIKQMKRGTSVPDGLRTDRRRSRALWSNRAQWCTLSDTDDIVKLINEIDHYIFDNAGFGWNTDPYGNAAHYLREDLCSEFGFTEEQAMNVFMLAFQNQ